METDLNNLFFRMIIRDANDLGLSGKRIKSFTTNTEISPGELVATCQFETDECKKDAGEKEL